MKQTVLSLLAVISLLFTASSCSNDVEGMEEETVQVTFCAELPQALTTRADNEENSEESEETTSTTSPYDDYTVECAVFEKVNESTYEEVTNLRQSVKKGENGWSYSPRLVKGRSYRIVFWASKEGAYDVTSMEAISRNSNTSMSAEADYDAFTSAVDFSGSFNEATPIAVSLSRPFAKINIGVTEEDWNGVVNGFKQTPTTIEVTVDDAYPIYNALTGSYSGNGGVTYTYSVSKEKKLGNYIQLSECYVLANSNVSVSYVIKDQSEKDICSGTITDVPAQSNYNTNIVGGLMTGTVSYSITFNSAFGGDNSKEID